MKSVILFTLSVFAFFAIITAIAKPDVIGRAYSGIRTPIDRYFAEKDSKIWTEAKAAERAIWMLKLQSPYDCRSPKTAIREIECNNLMQLHAQTFEQNWSGKVRSGWKPEGVSN